MREIKFRGKRINDKEWVFGAYFSDDKRHYIVTRINDIQHAVYGYRSNDVELYVVDPATVGQYTGLKDKNGVHIYEGDIVNMHYFFENFDRETLGAFEDEAEVVGVVRIDEMSVYTDCKKERFAWACYLQDPAEELEVIGNCLENPDLLEGGKADAD